MQKCPLVQSAFLSGFWTDLRHQYGIFGGESQTSLFPFRSSLRDVNERRLYSQARIFINQSLRWLLSHLPIPPCARNSQHYSEAPVWRNRDCFLVCELYINTVSSYTQGLQECLLGFWIHEVSVKVASLFYIGFLRCSC